MNLGLFMLFPMLLLGGGMGGANELVDYLQIEHYWRTRNITPDAATLSALLVEDPKPEDISALIKQLGHDDFDQREAATDAIAKKGPSVIPQLKAATKSPDAEVADRATKLIERLSAGDTDPLIHKLMILRALGETKDQAALKALKTQLDSKEPFVADHARRAIARIEGVAYTPSTTSAQTFAQDVWLLPKGVKLVTQLTMNSSGSIDWTKAMANVNSPLGADLPKEEVFKQMQQGVAVALNTVGNIRLDGVTMGLSDNPGPNTGYVVILARGRYDREKIKALFKSKGIESTVEHGIDTLSPPNTQLKLMLVSNELFMIIGGARDPKEWPVEQMAKAIKEGKGTVSEDETMAGLINAADHKSGGWAVIQMTEAYRKAGPWAEPFDTVIASRKTEKGKTTLKIEGKGRDAASVQGAVNIMNLGLDEARANIGPAGGLIPKPVIDFVTSLKIEAKETSAVLSGSMTGDFEDMLGAMLFPMMMMGGPGF